MSQELAAEIRTLKNYGIAAQERIEELERQLAEKADDLTMMAHTEETFEFRLAEARNAALEEAAKIAEDYAERAWGDEESAAYRIMDSIRARKTDTKTEQEL
jgi:hypothetical protein